MIVKSVIDKRGKKDGTHAVRISIFHGKDTRYISTDIHILPNEFSAGRIIKRKDSALLNTKLDKQIASVNKAIAELEYTECLTCKELVELIEGRAATQNPTIEDCYNQWKERLTCTETAKITYHAQYSMLTRFIPADTRLQHVTCVMLMDAEVGMRKIGWSQSTIRGVMMLLKFLFTFAKRRGVAFRKSPFEGYKIPKITIRENWLSQEQIRMIRDMEVTNEHDRCIRDMYMLTYYLGGINMMDLKKIKFGGKNISYVRQKTENRTHSKVEFEIHPKAWEIINRYINNDGYLVIPGNSSHNVYTSKHFHYIQRMFADKITFGSARKSIAEHLFETGCPTSVIDYILGHSIKQGTTCLYRYIKVKPEIATRWLWKVIDAL